MIGEKSMTNRFRILRILLCAGAFLAPDRGRAMEPKPLPANLTLTTMQGQKVEANALPRDKNWLLVYVSPRGPRSEMTLKDLEQYQSPRVIASMVIVVRGQTRDASRFQARHPALAAASWYVDPDGDAATLLQLHSLPSVIGVEHRMMRWKLGGFNVDRGTFRSILNSWVQSNVAQPGMPGRN
jgi:hypothetical protein